MKAERMIEILAEANITPTTKHHSYDYLYNQALTAMTRAVEEANQPLEERIVKLQDELFEKENNPNYQSDLTRLRQCEAIVRELADDDDFISVVLLRRKSKEWVRENPEGGATSAFHQWAKDNPHPNPINKDPLADGKGES